jgi:hypothetical protein
VAAQKKSQIAAEVDQFFAGQLKPLFSAGYPNGIEDIHEEAYRRIVATFPAAAAARNTSPAVARFLAGHAHKTGLRIKGRTITTDAYRIILNLLRTSAPATPTAAVGAPNGSDYFQTPGTAAAAPSPGLDPWLLSSPGLCSAAAVDALWIFSMSASCASAFLIVEMTSKQPGEPSLLRHNRALAKSRSASCK